MPRGRQPGSKSAKSAAGGGGGATSAAAQEMPAFPPSPYAHLPLDEALTAMNKDIEELVDPALFRLTSGMPRHELQTIVREAEDCEMALIEEIRILEEATGVPEEERTARVGRAAEEAKEGGTVPQQLQLPPHFTKVDDMLASDLSAASGFYGVSALVGRLRNPLEMPVAPNAPAAMQGGGNRKGRKKSIGGAGAAVDKEAERKEKDTALAKTRLLLDLKKDPAYTKILEDNAPLMSLCKRVSNHRSSIVFRRPVNPREAPGYTERIPFPIDLSLVKKMVQAGMIKSFADLHERMALICNNCVKYNGRESDYGGVTREFEAYVDDSFLLAVNTYNINAKKKAAEAAAAAAAATTNAPTAAAGAVSTVPAQPSTSEAAPAPTEARPATAADATEVSVTAATSDSAVAKTDAAEGK